MAPATFLTAKQAAQTLGITLATLYAYTSRGQLRSEPMPGEPRARRYHRDDVERLRDRKAARRDPSKAAARGLRWGEPVLESAITLIHDGSYYYRGRDAVELARTSLLEDVAALLWDADVVERSRLFTQASALDARAIGQLGRLVPETLSRLQAALPVAAAADVASYDLRPAAVRATGARILRLMTSLVTGEASRLPVHRALQEAWQPRRSAVSDVIRATLVLSADHELNVSAFTARCAASAGASPYDVVSAAMAAFRGFKHGGAAERALSLVELAESPSGARNALAAKLRQGERVPGFGHPLYPDGDPRAALLLELAQSSGNDRAWLPFRHLIKAGRDLLGEAPNVDLGLAAVARAWRLPDDAPSILFALGRTVGWIAQAMEEYAANRLIRPRARYTGLMPITSNPI
jgi:citrate synthase